MTSAESWLERLQALSNDKTFQNDVAQVRARALLKEVTQEAPKYNWTYAPSTVIRNATAATIVFEAISRSDPSRLRDLENVARQMALIWESVEKLGERTDSETAIINAAVAYEISGYQANAACLARKLSIDFSQIETPSLEAIASAFLQRYLLRVRLFSSKTRQEPTLHQDVDNLLLGDTALALAGEAFDNASRFLLGGDERCLARATEAFVASEKVYSSLGAIGQSNLVLSLRSVLPVMQLRSTWTAFPDLTKEHPRWERYLKLLARGIGDIILDSPSVSELWPSQITALSNGLLDPTISKIIKMPTSAGKTRVAELAIVHTLTTIPGSKCVYVAPYRALVYELEQSFLNLFGDLGFGVSTVVGTYESDDFEQLIASEADILVLTPEKLDLLQRAQPAFLNNVRLFIMDEGQIVHEEARGVKFELLLTRLKLRLKNARFLFLSAVVPQETLEDFAKWFRADPKKDVVVSRWRPSIQRYAKFEWSGDNGTIRYAPSDDIPMLKEFVSGVVKQQTFEFTNPKTSRLNRRRFPDPNARAQTAAELAFKFAERGSVLVFCSQPSYVEAVGNALETRLNYLELVKAGFPNHLTRSSQTASVLTSQEWLGDDHLVTRMLKNGVALHHGDLPEAVRKAVEKDFRERRLKIIIATNTLAQGVNLPIRTVIVHSCRRYDPEREAERIPASDYWNIAGRAGRAGVETEGLVIHLVLGSRDQIDFRYYLDHRENVEPIKGALFQLLDDLVNKRILDEEARAKLDPEILALLVEEGAESLSEETIKETLGESLVLVQASRYGIDLEKLRHVFKETADKINDNVSDSTFWPLYSSTGLCSDSCEILRQYALGHNDLMLGLLTTATYQDLAKLVQTCLEACLALPEMQPSRAFGGSYHDLLLGWLSGKGIKEIIAEFKTQSVSVEELGKFIEDFFCYKLPWGSSALVKISALALGVDAEKLSDFVRFFPSMVKLGVSRPSATWAFAAGIRFRSTAQKAAAKYLGETSTPSYRDFSTWIKGINSENLHNDFGLEGPILEEVNKAISRFSTNDLLRQSSRISELLPRESWVKGIEYENRQFVALSAKVGDRAKLIRDYDNTADRNAIEILVNDRRLGYLDRGLSQILAVEMDSGTEFESSIIEIEKHEVPQIKILVSTKLQLKS